MGLFKRKKIGDSSESDENSSGKKTELEAPSTLPDALMEQYGLGQEGTSTKKPERPEHPQKIPEDLVKEKEFLEKIHDDSSKIEYIKETENELLEDIKEEKVSEEKTVSSKKEQVKHSSFFDELEAKIKSGKHGVDEHFNSNLLDMMKRYHSARARGEHFFFHEQELEDELYKKMLKLKELENEWMVRAKEFNIAKELLGEKETDIDKVSEDLRFLIRKADKFRIFSKETAHDKAFRFSEGKILLSINDLLRELRNMSDEEYKHHVGKHKNDFAVWVLHVFSQRHLSELMKKCDTREEMIKILSEY